MPHTDVHTRAHRALLCLSIPSGANGAQSLLNLRNWIDDIATSVVKCGDPLVRDFHGNRLHGLYEGMKCEEHMQFFACLAGQTQWTTECANGNISAGKFVSVEPGGKGKISMQHVKAGPFV